MLSALAISICLFALMPKHDAQIHGIVSDVSGAVIARAAVSLSGANVQRRVQTQDDGSFLFPALAAGHYTLKVNYRGFETFEDHVSASSRLTLLVAIRLRPQAVTEARTVTENGGTELICKPVSMRTIIRGPCAYDLYV